jgi:hypothetical protein
MQTGSPLNRNHWRSLIVRFLIALAGAAIVLLARSFLEFRPPKLPDSPLYRVVPGVSGIGFFNGSCGERNDKGGYSYHFAKRDVRCIFAELHIPPTTPATAHAIFYGPNGQVLYEENLLIGNESAAAIAGFYEGQDEPGHWPPGIYRVEFTVAGELIAADEFQITDP